MPQPSEWDTRSNIALDDRNIHSVLSVITHTIIDHDVTSGQQLSDSLIDALHMVVEYSNTKNL